MEILFVSHKYPPSVGGMQKQSYELITRMQNVTKVHTLLYTGEEPKWKFFALLRRRIKSLLKKYPQTGTIHLNDGSLGAFCLWLPRITPIPVYVTLHGLDVVFPSKTYQHHIFPKFNRFHGIICVSHSTKDECVKRGIRPDRLHVIHNGVGNEFAQAKVMAGYKDSFYRKHGIRPEENIIISIGRPTKRKGFSWFIRNVLPHLKNTRYIIIGPYTKQHKKMDRLINHFPKSLKRHLHLLFGHPDDGQTIKQLLQSPAHAEKVIWAGKMAFPDMLQIMKFADLLVMPNINVEGDIEGFGLVALEAATLGLPVLAARTEGIVDAIHHDKNGYLVDSQKAASWIEAIHTYMKTQKDTSARVSRFQQYTLDHFSWDKMTQNYYQVFVQESSKVVTNTVYSYPEFGIPI